jgi:hypothetical protein
MPLITALEAGNLSQIAQLEESVFLNQISESIKNQARLGKCQLLITPVNINASGFSIESIVSVLDKYGFKTKILNSPIANSIQVIW